MMQSLRNRLNLGLFISLAALSVALWMLLGMVVRGSVEQFVVTRLEHDAESLLTALSFDAAGRLQLDEQRVQLIYQQPLSGHYYMIEAAGQRMESRSLWDERMDLLPADAAAVNGAPHSRLTRLPGPADQQLLVLREVFYKQGRQLSIALGEDISPIEQQLRAHQRDFSLLLLLLLALLLVLQTLIVSWSMRPVRAAQQALRQLETGELVRLPETVPTEVLPLVREVNRLITQQQVRLQRSRHALGDVAHAIKTPLSLIMQWYEALPADARTQYQMVSEQLQQISRRIDSELKRARLAGDYRGGAGFDLQTDLPALIATLQKLYHDKPVSVEQERQLRGRLPLEREDGMELLGNVLDNAWKWSRRRIRISLSQQADRVRLQIEDDGPGIDVTQAESLQQRGNRADESIAGHGIGLAIVRNIVHGYHGELRLQRSPDLGGLLVEMEFPLQGEGM